LRAAIIEHRDLFDDGCFFLELQNHGLPEQMRVIERFTLDPESMQLTREYAVTDPVYLAEPYTGQDIVLVSETRFERHPCEELTYEFTEGGAE
jgi:DNA polymerase III alpha subunit